MAGQRHDHRRALPWHSRWQAAGRDPLLRLESAHRRQGPAAPHQRPLVNREQLALGAGRAAAGRRPPLPGRKRRPDPGQPPQPGHQCPATRWDLVDHREDRSPGSRHQRVAQAARVARACDGSELLMLTSNRPCSSRISRTFRRSSGEVNRPRPLPRRPESFLRRSTVLPPPQGPCPYGATPVAASAPSEKPAARSPAGPPGAAFGSPSDRLSAGHWHPGLLGASGPPVQETAPAHGNSHRVLSRSDRRFPGPP